jgi:nucleotide-binding universal stress UspA family protein
MFKNIVVPLDGSFTAEKILAWAEEYALRGSAKIELVRVIPTVGLSKESDHERARERDDALRYLEAVSERLAEKNLKSEVYVRSGAPAQVVVDLAKRLPASMIAMTTRGSTTVKRGLFGGTAEKILRLSPRAMFVMHASEDAPQPPVKMRRILVPLDGSELSESVLPAVAQLARWHESKVLLVHAHPYKVLKQVDEERFETLCKVFEHRGVTATYIWAPGDPAEEILRMAQRKKPGLIAMNTHGRSGFSRFLLGSVAEEVVHGAQVPVFMTVNTKPVKLESPERVETPAAV